MDKDTTFNNLAELAKQLREGLNTKKTILLYAYNGTGKTRLSVEFKNLGKEEKGGDADTLYFNAFTEDLFSWDNDLEGDRDRKLKFNKDSKFFSGLESLEMDNRVRPLLSRYADFDFRIDIEDSSVSFSRKDKKNIHDELTGEETVVFETTDNIKISRGEENIFIWCFFLAFTELAVDKDEAYKWVQYIYIDDPISSLDEQNAIAVGNHLSQLIKRQDNTLKTVISTHHALFFNVLCNEMGRAQKLFLSSNKSLSNYRLKDTGDTPFFFHIATLVELKQAAESGKLYTYHFNMLRNILEKTASFHGLSKFSDCIKLEDRETDEVLHTRVVNILSHGNYSLYEPKEMLDENKEYFRRILNGFLKKFPFNQALFENTIA
jgi:hypothetical protein